MAKKILTKKKKTIIICCTIVLVVALVVGCVFLADYNKKEKVTLNVIGTQDIVENVNATGKVTSGASVEYKVGAVATVKEVFVKVGDTVHKGDVLATFDTKDIDEQIANMQGAYNDALNGYNDAVKAQNNSKKDLANVNKEISKLEKEVANLKGAIEVEKQEGEAQIQTTEQKLKEIADIVAKYAGGEEQAKKITEIVSKTVLDSVVAGEKDPAVIAGKVEAAIMQAQANGEIQVSDIDAMLAEIKGVIANSDWNKIGNDFSSESNVVKLTTTEIRLASMYAQREVLNISANNDVTKVQDRLVKSTKSALDSAKEIQAELAQGWTASIDGVITECNIVPDTQTNLFTTGIKLENMDSLTSTISLTEYDVHKVSVGMPAVVTTAFGTYTGEVASIAPVASGGGGASILDSVGSMAGISGLSSLTQSGAGVECTVTINDPDSNIIVGFDADIEIETGVFNDVPVVPIESLVLEKTGSYVYKYDEEDKTVTKTPITTGAISDTAYQITSGLEIGDKIVATPSATFKDDTFEVRVVDKEKKAKKSSKKSSNTQAANSSTGK